MGIGPSGNDSKGQALDQSQSNISNVNPLEDPFAEEGFTPLPPDNDTFSFADNERDDAVMVEEHNAQDALLQAHKSVFDEVFDALVR